MKGIARTFISLSVIFIICKSSLAEDFQFDPKKSYDCDVRAWLKDATIPNWADKYVVKKLDSDRREVRVEIAEGYDSDFGRTVREEIFSIANSDGNFVNRFEVTDSAFKGRELIKKFNNLTLRVAITNCEAKN